LLYEMQVFWNFTNNNLPNFNNLKDKFLTS